MRYLLIVITFFMGFSSLPAWAMDCYAEHEGGNTVVIGYVPRISIPSDGKKGDKIWQSSEYFMNVFCIMHYQAHLQEKNTHLHGQI